MRLEPYEEEHARLGVSFGALSALLDPTTDLAQIEGYCCTSMERTRRETSHEPGTTKNRPSDDSIISVAVGTG